MLLACWSTALLAQPLKILPPALDDSAQRVFFGSSVTLEGLLGGGAEVYSIDFGGQQRLTHFATANGQTAGEFAVSTDGSELIFTALNPTGSKLRVIKLDSGVKYTFNSPSGTPGSPHFAGNDKVLFDAFASPSPHTPSYGAPIYVSNIDGTGITALPRGALAPGPERVVSDHGVVVFTSADPFSTHALPFPPANVYLMALDGSNVRQVTHFIVPPQGVGAATIAAGATISASGDIIAFEAFSGTGYDAPSQIWTASVDGSTLRALTQPDETCDWPSLSADGTLVAFTCKGQVYAERSDGSGRRALTHFHLSSASSPVISGDGSRVFFTLGPLATSFRSLWGPTQMDSYARGAIWSALTDGTNVAPVYAPRVLVGIEDAISHSSLYPPVGGLISAFGANLTGDILTSASSTPVPNSLNGLSMSVNAQPAAILAVTPWQINAQIPPSLPDGPAKFEIQFPDGAISNAIQQEVRAISPNIFTVPSQDTADCQDAVFHAGTGIPADAKHPAQAGETVEIYATGLGPTRPQLQAGMAGPVSPLATLRFPVTLLLGGVPATVAFAGLTPGLIGVYQIDATIPSGLTGNRQQVTLSVNGGTLFTGACRFSVQ
jgi:uncharacterized protein (TIGR03437 family)